MAAKPFDKMEVNWITQPDPIGVATLGVTICLGAISLIVVILHVWARMGTRDARLEEWNSVAGIKVSSFPDHSAKPKIDRLQWLVFFQITYAWSLPFIKASICFTVFRITNRKRYRVILWTAMIASILSTTIGFIAVVAVCRPVSYTWDKSLDGSFAPTNIITSISYLISVMAIITDWTCAIVPTVVVCGLQMKSRVKASVCAVLALGAIASAATIIRLPYLQYYNVVDDYLHEFPIAFHAGHHTIERTGD
ncbi:hypothetical protein Brms1b_013690 [Colletotrichum noveboracense]|nr:hypothetical protein Brms1b_013690 [Colletotrichum noveboracense]